jgi:hypothetical protein
MTKVVHCKKKAYDIYIGRPSIWGNPFAIGRDGSREEVILKYEAYIKNNPKLMRLVKGLQNQTLGCWCKPLSCHGDVLAKLADGVEVEDESKWN